MLEHQLSLGCLDILSQTVNDHTFKTMFRLSCWFLVALLFSVHCLQRQILYSRLYKEVSNSSLAVPLGKVASRVHCAILCFGDDYCAEFLYSETSRQCVGLHCVKKGSYLYQYKVLETAQMLHYEKGKFACLIEKHYSNDNLL